MATKITRNLANKLILEELAKANDKWDDLRFGQLLLITGINVSMEDLYIESTTVLEKVKGENT